MNEPWLYETTGGNYYNASTPHRPANNWQNANQFNADKAGSLPPPPGTHPAWQTPSPSPSPPTPGPHPPLSSGAIVSGSDTSSNFLRPPWCSHASSAPIGSRVHPQQLQL